MNSYQQDYLTVLHEKLQELQDENARLRADLKRAKDFIKELCEFGLSYGDSPLIHDALKFIGEE